MSDPLERIAVALERLAPAPMPAPDFDAAGAFAWHVGPDRLEPVTDPDALEKRIEKESRFDPDIWIVEIEAGSVPVEELIALRTP